MKIKKFTFNLFRVNCYIYYDENSLEAILIDPGAYDKKEEDEILNFINDLKINVKYTINTHGHIDHVLGNNFAKKTFNCPLLIHEDDLFLLNYASAQGILYNLEIHKSPIPDLFITEDLNINLNNLQINFIHTPGHSPGGICIVDHKNKIIFSGDTIFEDSIGRVDLPGGDFKVLLNSIKNKLFNLCNDNYILYPGHLDETTIRKEKNNNPFLQ